MNPDSSPANPTPDAPAPEAPVEQLSEGDLNFEMTQEQEEAYVAKVLGQGVPEAVEAPVVEEETVTPPEPVVPKEEPKEEPKTEPVEEKPVVIEDIKTDDLFIEVTIHEEDDEGELTEKKLTLTYDPKDPTAFLPDGFKADSNKQLLAILDARDEIKSKYNERVKEHEKLVGSKAESDRVAAQSAIWDQEILDLQTAGVMEAPKITDVNDPKYGQDPAVRKTEAVFEYMMRENIKRADEGKPIISSFGTAFNLYQHDADVVAAKEAKDKENKDAKLRGAMVGGGSSATTGGKAPTYVAGSANSIHNLKIDV